MTAGSHEERWLNSGRVRRQRRKESGFRGLCRQPTDLRRSTMFRTTLIALVAALTASLSMLMLSTTASAGNRSPAQTGQFFLKNTKSPAASTRHVGAVLVCDNGTCRWFRVVVMDLD